jgi:Txe/YoeB family toxin of Txe-Axe toxin-antitoxin module
MPHRWDVVWVDHAAEQFNSLSPQARAAVMELVAQLERDPYAAGRYDPRADHYTARFSRGDIAGLLWYVIGDQRVRVVVLRVAVV